MKKQYGVKKIELVHYKIKELRKWIIFLLVIIGFLCWYSWIQNEKVTDLIEVVDGYAAWAKDDAEFIEEYRATILEMMGERNGLLREIKELELEVTRKDSIIYDDWADDNLN